MHPDADSATPDDALGQVLVAAERLQGVRGRSVERRAGSDQAHIRWRLLREVAAGGRTVADVARRLHATRAEMKPLADALVLDGLARYEPNPAPRRAQRIALTDEGARTLELLEGSARAWLVATGSTETSAEIESTRRFLLMVVASSEAVADG